MGKRAFVTVGSTSFDELSRAVLSASVLSELRDAGYSSIMLQHGSSGASLPQAPKMDGVELKMFEYSPSLSQEMKNADLIVSHAGAGSILEALKLRKLLIVVANESLMDNHQLELANKLSTDGLCLSATPSTLGITIQNLSNAKLRNLPDSDGVALNSIIKQELDKL